jgi:hypothetical protein
VQKRLSLICPHKNPINITVLPHGSHIPNPPHERSFTRHSGT